jgi:hypothetical protein
MNPAGKFVEADLYFSWLFGNSTRQCKGTASGGKASGLSSVDDRI